MDEKETFRIPEDAVIDEEHVLPVLKQLRTNISMDDSRIQNVVERSVEDVSLDDMNLYRIRSKPARMWNSTSSLFVKSTMNKPDISRCIRCVSSLLASRLSEKPARTPFDETRDTFKRVHIDRHALYRYILNIFMDAQMTNECVIMALIYIDRVCRPDLDDSLPLTRYNVRPVIMICMMLASKVWDDVSMWNGDFAEIYPYFKLDQLNDWEIVVLDMLSFDIVVSGREYAEYYFSIRDEEIKLNGGLEIDSALKPLDESVAQQLEALSSEKKKSLINEKKNRATSMNLSSEDVGHRVILS